MQKENFQMCNVTNPKIRDQLKPKVPQATLSCNAQRKDCNFQCKCRSSFCHYPSNMNAVWIDHLESFYCALDRCEWDLVTEANRNTTTYQCKTLNCSCVEDRPLCEENGIDLTGFFNEEIKGPAKFKTVSTEGGSPQDGSTFEEPAMDGLISNFFGDDSIFLDCRAGECLYETDVPGYEKPIKRINTPLIAGVIAGCALFVVAAILLVWYLSRRSNTRRYGPLHVSDADNSLLMADHRPTSLHFDDVAYLVNGKQILSGVQGAVHPGQLMAIMGASGAGKTTFLDILARKNKKGISRGNFYVNGQKMSDHDFRSVIGFVDQEDTLLPTLTVHETILDSALLRLPKDMARSAKEQKVDDVEKQLGIFHIRDSIIGAEDVRGISGGEKRRVGIACELVTSPCILFLDEPTSGLDAYNAYNVIECLVNLVKTYQRTVVFTIHQPRSNIVAMFDQLVLLARGHTVYSGPFSSCQDYFSNMGYACPPGFNIADYLVDITMCADDTRSPMDDVIEAEAGNNTRSSSLMAIKSIASKSNIHLAQGQSETSAAISPRASAEWRGSTTIEQPSRGLFSRKKQSGVETPTSQVEEEQSLLDSHNDPKAPWLRLSRQKGTPPPQNLEDPHQLPPEAAPAGTHLDDIIASYRISAVANAVATDIKDAITSASTPAAGNSSVNGGTHINGDLLSRQVKGYRRIGLIGQFRVLSVRTWRNLYRNPMLMLTHYAIAIVLAVFLGFLFYGVTDNIAGFQNRLGLFFFVLALFGFSTLTSLTVFAQERLLFLRERAKGYYRPIAYFAAKVFFDIVPLRLIPPIILGAVVYPMTGLVPEAGHFFKFIAFLILFNFAAAAICLFLGVIFRNGGVANLIGSLTMLFSLLFSGFLLNHESIPKAVLWLQVVRVPHRHPGSFQKPP